MMWEYTEKSLPPKGEVLAVRRRPSSRSEPIDEDAVWDGTHWTRRPDGQSFEPNAYYAWRRLET